MFEIYNKDIEIKGKTYTFCPLNGDLLPDLFEIMSNFKKAKEESTDDTITASALDKQTMSTLHKLAFETMKISYPSEDTNKLNQWVSQNLMLLIEPLVEVNVNTEIIENDA